MFWIYLVRIVAAGISLLLAFSGIYMLAQGVYIGLIAGEEKIELFMFGSEAWIETGWWFESRLHFLANGVIKGLSMMIPACLIMIFAFRLRRSHAI